MGKTLNCTIIPETVIEKAHDAFNGKPNNFSIIIEKAKIFKSAGMTPIYIYDEYKSGIYVVAEETYGKLLH